MMAKIILPLLLIVSAVAADEIDDICSQLVTQFNSLQSIKPLEVGVMFPRKQSPYINGPAVYKLVTPLTQPENGCISKPVQGSNKKHITMKFNSNRAYIMSPTRIFTIFLQLFTLELEVEPSETGEARSVTVVDFTIDFDRIMETLTAIPVTYRNYFTTALQGSIKSTLQKKLNTIFEEDARVEIDGSLARDLMINVFQVAAQQL